MQARIPTADEVRSALAGLGHAQMQELSRLSGVPFTTLWKVRDGTTANPGIKTVGLFIGFIDEVKNKTEAEH